LLTLALRVCSMLSGAKTLASLLVPTKAMLLTLRFNLGLALSLTPAIPPVFATSAMPRSTQSLS